MSKAETLTIRVSSEVKSQLELIALSTQRSKSFLASQAIARFVATEAEIIEGIKAGLADMETGRVVSHDVAMSRIRATISNPRRTAA